MDGQNRKNNVAHSSRAVNPTTEDSFPLGNCQSKVQSIYNTFCAYRARLEEVSSLHKDEVEKNKTLQEQNQQKDLEIEQLNEIIQNLKSKDESLTQTSTEEALNCLQEQNETIQELTATLGQLEVYLQSQDNRLSEELKKTHNLMMENGQKNAEIKELKQSLTDLQSKEQKYLNKISEYRNYLKKVQEQIQEREGLHVIKHHSLQHENNKLSATIEILHKDAKASKTIMNYLSSQIQAETEEKLKLKAEVDQLKVYYENYEGTLEQLRTTLREQDMTMFSMKQQSDQDILLFQAEIEGLTQDQTRLQSDLKKRNSELVILNARLDEINTLYDKELKKNNSLVLENDEQKADLKELKELVMNLHHHHHHLSEKAEGLNCTINKLSSHIQEQTEKNLELIAKVGELQEQLQSLEEKNTQLSKEKTECESIISLTKERSEQNRLEFLAQIEALTEEQARLQSIIEQAEAEKVSEMASFQLSEGLRNAELETQNELQKMELQQLKELIKGLQSREAKFHADEIILKTKLEEISTLRSEEQWRNNNLELENGQLRAECSQLSATVDLLCEEANKTKDTVNNLNSQIQEQQETISNLESRKDLLKSRICSQSDREQQEHLAEIEKLSKDKDTLRSRFIKTLDSKHPETPNSNEYSNGQDDTGPGTSSKWTKGLLIAGGYAIATGAFLKYGSTENISGLLSSLYRF